MAAAEAEETLEHRKCTATETVFLCEDELKPKTQMNIEHTVHSSTNRLQHCDKCS